MTATAAAISSPTQQATAQERTEAGLRGALAYAQSIVDTVREPLLVLDGELRVRTASNAFYQSFGVSEEETIGQFLYHLGNEQWNIPALRMLLEQVLPQEKSLRDFEVVHEFPALGRRVMLLNARELMDEGHNTGRVLLAIEDITERERTQEELVRSNEDLQRFAYVAAHDLRSPLHAALNFSSLLEQRLEGRLDLEESSLLTLSIESLQRLSALMRDILTYSGIGNAPEQRALVLIKEPLAIALANLQHHIEKSGATIIVDALPTVPADRMQLTLVFQNLISNAIKYRRAAEPPRIRIEAIEQDDHWQISIADNGQGFEARYAAAIFEAFKRLQGAELPGSGIGLATCKRIIERSGGRIWAVSTPGEGSTFFFTVPVAQG